MSQTAVAAPSPLRFERWAPPLFGGLLLLLLAGRLLGFTDVAHIQTFAIIFTAIVVEALPFVLLGAFAAALIEVYVSDRLLGKITQLPTFLQLPAAALGGFAFPVCECGSVPVARRLIKRGMHPGAGVVFMLASPVFNPIVLLSTWVAYSTRGLGTQMVIGRAALGLVTALAAGWALGSEGAQELLRSKEASETEHEHGAGAPAKRKVFIEHLSGDFFFMGKFLLAGAALSAGFQTMLPQSLISGVARTAVIGTLALMTIAFLSSLCSEADAFVAVSFTQFPLGSQLAFLVFGPVLDLKLVFLYSAAFRKRFVLSLAAVVVPTVLAGSLVAEVFLR
jgi:uncharacterized membrane protein YraQ (UPF0718 family)